MDVFAGAVTIATALSNRGIIANGHPCRRDLSINLSDQTSPLRLRLSHPGTSAAALHRTRPVRVLSLSPWATTTY